MTSFVVLNMTMLSLLYISYPFQMCYCQSSCIEWSIILIISQLHHVTSSIFKATGLSGYDIDISIGSTHTVVIAYIDSSQHTLWHGIGFGGIIMRNRYTIIQQPGTPTPTIPTFREHKLSQQDSGTVLDATASHWNISFNASTNPYILTMIRENDIAKGNQGSNYYTFDPLHTTLDVIYAIGISSVFTDGHGPGTFGVNMYGEQLREITPSPTNNPSVSPTDNPSTTPTNNPSIAPTKYPSVSPTKMPSISPTNNPSTTPTNNPSTTPTKMPSISPTNNPSTTPSNNPSTSPTNNPSIAPTKNPSISPTDNPSISPTNNPSISPTKNPSILPTNNPSISPSNDPSISPTTSIPTTNPTTSLPSVNPTTSVPTTSNPSVQPTTSNPTKHPITTTSPTNNPSISPSNNPSISPTKNPSISPTKNPSISPTNNPIAPSNDPSISPTTSIPTTNPTTSIPSVNPTTSVPTTSNPTKHPITRTSPTSSSVGATETSVSIDKLLIILLLVAVICCCIIILIIYKKRDKYKYNEEKMKNNVINGNELISSQRNAFVHGLNDDYPPNTVKMGSTEYRVSTESKHNLNESDAESDHESGQQLYDNKQIKRKMNVETDGTSTIGARHDNDIYALPNDAEYITPNGREHYLSSNTEFRKFETNIELEGVATLPTDGALPTDNNYKTPH